MTDAAAIPSHREFARRFYFGPCGWSYPDWAGIVYPSGVSRRFDALEYLARYFDAVEVNVSFYRPVPPRMSAAWIRRVASHARFRFAFKLHQSFTHERGRYSADAVRTYVDGVRPVVDAGRLACVLMQFPWSFRRGPDSLNWLRRLAGDFESIPLAVELRHDSWSVADTHAWLKDAGIAWCNIDQPPLVHCVGPTAVATSPIGYIRLHGRRSDTWFAEGIAAHERYNYLYAEDELREWVPRIHDVGDQADRVYVFTNNHYRGQAPANALQLRAMIEGGPVAVPEALGAHYPALDSITDRSKSFPESLL
ncbi:MAG: DUF72 domain-containing protein [Phycisphaerales bacterium]|nr:DUF72 domain-containing protein [Phycisphaerales bacterium]